MKNVSRKLRLIEDDLNILRAVVQRNIKEQKNVVVLVVHNKILVLFLQVLLKELECLLIKSL